MELSAACVSQSTAPVVSEPHFPSEQWSPPQLWREQSGMVEIPGLGLTEIPGLGLTAHACNSAMGE